MSLKLLTIGLTAFLKLVKYKNRPKTLAARTQAVPHQTRKCCIVLQLILDSYLAGTP